MSAIQQVARELQAEVRSSSHGGLAPAELRSSAIRRWFHNLPVARKVRVIFGSFFALALVMLAVLSIGLYEVHKRDVIHNDMRGALQEAANLRGKTGEFRYNAVRFIFAREPAALERQRIGYAEAARQLAAMTLASRQHSPGLLPQLTEIGAALGSYDAKFNEVQSSIARFGDGGPSSKLAFELSQEGDALFALADALQVDFSLEAEALKAANITFLNRVLWLFGIATLLAIAALFIGMRYFTRDFSVKVAEITGGMTKLARGDRDFDIAGIERKDEVGEMLRAIALFKRGTIKLESWAKERAERAAAEFQEQAQARAETQRVLGQIANEFEQTVGEVVGGVAAASSQLKLTASTMAGAAERTAYQAGEVAKSMTQANAGATSASAASDEFALSIGEISRQASSSADLAREANEAAAEADATMSTLSVSAAEIGQIVDLIQSIARRTNLLALNASIEAARGGEAGRGFAVVASEVKDLAAQTSRATDQVAERIKAIQDSTGASVAALSRISSQVSELESTAISIATAVDQQSLAGQELARNIDLAARSTHDVSGHIDDVRDLSQTTGTAASQVLASSTELEHQADELRGQVDRFLAKVRAG